MILEAVKMIVTIRNIMMVCIVCWISSCSVSTGTSLFTKVGAFPPSAYYNWAESASDEELTRERQRLERADTSRQVPVSTVQYAIILSMIDDDTGMDIHGISSFLSEELTDLENSDNRHTNAYMTFGLIWQRQLELEISNGNVKNNNSQADSRIRLLEDKIQSLESTIRAFTDIEQELNQRDDNEDTP